MLTSIRTVSTLSPSVSVPSAPLCDCDVQLVRGLVYLQTDIEVIIRLVLIFRMTQLVLLLSWKDSKGQDQTAMPTLTGL